MALGALLCAIAFSVGCGTRAVYVPNGEPVRLRTTIRRAPVWIAGQDGREIPVRMDLPAGWYCLPDPGPELKK